MKVWIDILSILHFHPLSVVVAIAERAHCVKRQIAAKFLITGDTEVSTYLQFIQP